MRVIIRERIRQCAPARWVMLCEIRGSAINQSGGQSYPSSSSAAITLRHQTPTMAASSIERLASGAEGAAAGFSKGVYYVIRVPFLRVPTLFL